MKSLPASVKEFVQAQATVPVEELWKPTEPPESPYGSHWYRAVAAMLRSGRVTPNGDGSPNRTELNRLCKEANLNQYLFERIAHLLLTTKVIHAEPRVRFVEGKNHARFWNHRRKELTEVVSDGVLEMVQKSTGYLPWRPTTVNHSLLIEFLTVFFRCFEGQAIREDQLGPMMLEFSTLPNADLLEAAKCAKLNVKDVRYFGWKPWLDEKGQGALLSAMYTAEWAYYAKRNDQGWVFPSPIGLGMLGLGPMPAPPTLATELKADSNLAIFAGAGIEIDKLALLMRCCKIQRIDQFIELQVDPKRLKEIPNASEELRAALGDLDPMPASLVTALQTKSSLGGKISIRHCSAIVKPATPEALAAIRQHAQLKGYLEAGAPPGYLLIKPNSNPDNFIRRCRELGFEIDSL